MADYALDTAVKRAMDREFLSPQTLAAWTGSGTFLHDWLHRRVIQEYRGLTTPALRSAV